VNFPRINERPAETADATKLVLKPEIAFLCPPGSDYYGPTPDPTTMQLAAYLSDEDGEVAADSPSFASSDTNILTVHPSTGLVTAVAPGRATVTVTSGARKAFSLLTVQAGNDCCEDVPVASAFVIDNSVSMSALFGAGYPTRLEAARKIAHQFLSQFNDAKDTAGFIWFNEVAGVQQELTSVIGGLLTDSSLVHAVNLIPHSASKVTSLWAGMSKALEMLRDTTNRRVIVLFSDGEDRPLPGSADAADMANEVEAFKAASGIVIVVGIRATGAGYVALRDLSSDGFFINVLDSAGVMTAIEQLAGLQCYYCSGVRPMEDGYECLSEPLPAQSPDGDALGELEQSVQTL